MSDILQDKAATPFGPQGPGPAAKGQPPIKHQFESTPVKKKYGTDLAFTSTVPQHDQVRKQLASEMKGRWLGAMPVNEFLHTYLSTSQTPVPLPPLSQDVFSAIPTSGAESAFHDPFIAAIVEWTPHLHAVNTSTKENSVNKLKLKPDISLYNRVEGVAPPSTADFTQIELWMEFKTNSGGVAFRDPKDATDQVRHLAIEQESFIPATVDAINARGQLARYAGAQHSLQFRHFSFSVVIEGDRARFLRWDPAGTVVTAAFNYHDDPENMAEFLWRFDQLSAKDRGHDKTMRPAELEDDVDARVREKLRMKDTKFALFEYDLPGLEGMGHAYGPRPPYQNQSLVSRCTRGLPVVWMPGTVTKDNMGPWCREDVIFLKDTWRFLSDSANINVLPEHEIYAKLQKVGTPNIPDRIVGGDIQHGMTKTQEMVNARWLCVAPRISPYQHYRLVLGIVGRAVTTFSCTKELVTGVLDAMKAHAHAFNRAKILHRDINPGNILLTDDGRGLLIDWELAKQIDEVGSRRPDRTGTWQFMSANLLRVPGRMHTFVDDLESFLHVLGWVTLRYLPAADSYEVYDRANDLAIFDEHSMRHGLDYGGFYKCIVLRADSYPSDTFHPRTITPLEDLIRTLSSPFKSLYSLNPPNKALCKKYDELKRTNSGNEQIYLDHVVHMYNQDMDHLNYSWFFSTIEDALAKGDWPPDDHSVEDLPVSFRSFMETDRQDVRKTSQLQTIHSQWVRSKGLPRSLKRVASPTADSPAAKRGRHTLAASGSGN